MRIALALILVVHGLIHLIGAAKAFGWAEVAALHQPVPPRMGAAWLAAAVILVTAGVLLFMGRQPWWVFAVTGAALSQWLIGTVWKDAKFGTLGNIIIIAPLIMALLGGASVLS